jgi:hypothetical protein
MRVLRVTTVPVWCSVFALALAAIPVAAQQPAAPQAPAQQPAAEQPSPHQPAAPQPGTQQPAASQGEELTFEGDTALWSVAIRPDKTSDFEQVIAKLRAALASSDQPERQRQAGGWKVMRLSTPLPDGNVVYVHMINPVVPGADYSIMRILYDAYPQERQALYDLYRGAFAQNLSLATGEVVADFSPAAGAPPAHPSAEPGAPKEGTPAPPPPAAPPNPTPSNPGPVPRN